MMQIVIICDVQAASNGGAKTGTMTVSSPGLGQVALQIPQQVSQVSHTEPPGLITALQSPQGPAGKMRGQQTAVQVVQQVNQAGQVVHQVLQTVPQSSSHAGLSPAPSLQTSMAPLSTLGETPQSPQSCPPSSNLLDISVPTSIASKLPTAPLARPDLPTSSTAGTVVASASPQQNPSGGKPGENQQEAISAIVHSLMMAETQLKLEEQRKAGPVLPTVPVPAASLAARVTVSSNRIMVSRPGAGAGLPTYSQAISLSTSPSSLRRSSESPAQVAQVSPPVETAGTLSALLADTPAADKPLAGSSLVSGNSLLERLVSGTAQSGLSASASSSNLSPAASQLPSVQTGGGAVGGGGQSNGGGEEITLQSLLSGPAKVQSPSKVSPLLQQLQQPVQSYPASLTSPRHPPPSPRPVTSPRQVTPPSPSRANNPAMSALQQQLMQPPAPRYPGPGLAGGGSTHSILSAQLTAPPRNTAQVGQPGQANGQNTVQLVSQSGQQVQLLNQVQPQVQLVNHHVNNTVQLVNSPSQPAVQLVSQQPGIQQVQLVNQVAGASSGQQIVVNNVPMQLSLSHPVQFSVNLGESTASSIATIANGATQTPILVSGAGQPGNSTV